MLYPGKEHILQDCEELRNNELLIDGHISVGKRRNKEPEELINQEGAQVISFHAICQRLPTITTLNQGDAWKERTCVDWAEENLDRAVKK